MRELIDHPTVVRSDERLERAGRLLFNKANPDVPGMVVRDRDEWFDETRDYWLRAAAELVELLEWDTLTVECPCGWTVSGPAAEASTASFVHKCEKTDPYFSKRPRLT